jgi:hypothetical protein
MLGLGTMWSGDAFLAMSLVQPGTKLTDVRLGPSLCTSAKDALARVHAHGVVHGDVRLENMLHACLSAQGCAPWLLGPISRRHRGLWTCPLRGFP